MSFIINPYIFGTNSFYQYASQRTDNTDLYDPGGLLTAGTFTVPSNWNSRRVRSMAGVENEFGASNTLECLKNSASYDGGGATTHTAITGSTETATVVSAPVVVSTSDTFTWSGTGGSTGGNWRFVEVLPSTHIGALVNRITSSFSVGAAFTVVNWNNEIYDDSTFHDNSTNPSRMTIGAGTTGLIRLSASVQTASSGGEIGIQLLKNGAALSSDMQMDSTGDNLSVMSPPLVAANGDYFEVQVRTTSATNVAVDANSWFAIEELPAGLQYAIARVTSNNAIPSGSTYTAFTADVEEVDVGGWFTAGQSKFTVPSGVTQVRVGFYLKSSNTLGSTWTGAIFKNAAAFDGMPINGSSNTNVEFVHAVSGILQVTAGDTLDFYAKTAAGSMNVAAGSFVWIEEVPAVIL